MKIILKITLLIIFTSCASTVQYAKYYDPLEKDPTEGSAKICIIREKVPWGTAVRAKIYQDSLLVGKLGYASHLSWESKPKSSFLIATTENKDSVNIDLQKDKTYYLKMNYQMGFLIARAKLSIINKEEFIKIYKSSKKPNIVNN